MRFVVIAMIILIPSEMFSQESTSVKNSDSTKWTFSFTYSRCPFYGPEGANFFGLSIRYDLFEALSLNYTVSFAKIPDIGNVTHVFAGPVYGLHLFESIGDYRTNDDDDEYYSDDEYESECEARNEISAVGAILAVCFMILPEGVTVNINLNDDYSVHPYMNFLGIEYNKGIGTHCSEFGVGAAIGRSKKFIFMPRIGYRMALEGNRSSLIMGINIGFRF